MVDLHVWRLAKHDLMSYTHFYTNTVFMFGSVTWDMTDCATVVLVPFEWCPVCQRWESDGKRPWRRRVMRCARLKWMPLISFCGQQRHVDYSVWSVPLALTVCQAVVRQPLPRRWRTKRPSHGPWAVTVRLMSERFPLMDQLQSFVITVYIYF